METPNRVDGEQKEHVVDVKDVKQEGTNLKSDGQLQFDVQTSQSLPQLPPKDPSSSSKSSKNTSFSSSKGSSPHHRSSARGSIGSGVTAFTNVGSAVLETLKKRHQRGKGRNWGDLLYAAWLGLMQLSWFEPPRSTAARIIGMGFGIVSLVFCAAYTAGLTARLTEKVTATAVLRDYSALLDLKESCCTTFGSGLSDVLRSKYPTIKQTNMQNFFHGLELMQERKCSAIFYDEPLAEYQQNQGCDYVL